MNPRPTTPPSTPPQKEGLIVKDVVVLIDREQGGEAHLAANGLKLHAAFKLSALLDVLQKHGHVSDEVAAKVRQFIAENQTKRPAAAAAAPAAAKPKRCAGGQAGGWGSGRAACRASGDCCLLPGPAPPPRAT
jgi:hypothetical protein